MRVSLFVLFTWPLLACGAPQESATPQHHDIVEATPDRGGRVDVPDAASPSLAVGVAPSELDGGGADDSGFVAIQDLGHGADTPPNTLIRQEPARVSGNLGATEVRNLLRQHLGRFSLCYENGLRTNPALGGRLVIKFTIDEHGTVQRLLDDGSGITDALVISCIEKGIAEISFPAPRSGDVKVVYPLDFAPR